MQIFKRKIRNTGLQYKATTQRERVKEDGKEDGKDKPTEISTDTSKTAVFTTLFMVLLLVLFLALFLTLFPAGFSALPTMRNEIALRPLGPKRKKKERKTGRGDY